MKSGGRHVRTCRTTLIAYALAGGLFLIIVTVPMSALSRSSQELGGQNSATKVTADVRELAPGATIERELKRGEVHFYRIALASGQYLHAAVEQLNIDVVVKLLGPDNQQLAEANNWKSQDREQLSLVAEAPAEYRLEVRSVDKAASPGRYELRIEVLGTVTAEDKSRIAADRSFAEAERLRAQGTAESRRKAIEKYEEALPLWRSLGDRQEEGKTLLNIGVSYSDLGEIRKSLGYLDQALLLKRALGDRRREAITLSIIGESYWSLGDIPKALQYYDEALSVSRAIGYREGEALALNNQGVAYRDSGELGKALECYRQAGSIWGALGILGGESYMFQNIGSLYWRLGEDQKALEYFDQALSVRRALGAGGGEAFTLTSMGAVFSSLCEPQKALEFYNQSLPFSRDVGDRKLEGVALHSIGVAYSLLAEYQKALAYFDQAMLLRRAVG